MKIIFPEHLPFVLKLHKPLSLKLSKSSHRKVDNKSNILVLLLKYI